MRALRSVWAAATRDEREAFHRVTCQNDRNPQRLAIVKDLTARLRAALQAGAPGRG